MEKYILSVLVQNNSGVLARVTSLFGRRGYNIESLTVSATQNEQTSRITLVATGDDYILEQIVKQLSKLEETIKVQQIKEDKSFCRELLLTKLALHDNSEIAQLREVSSIYGARIVDLTPTSMIIELTAASSKIDSFVEMIQRYEILEMCRTGMTAMERGEGVI